MKKALSAVALALALTGSAFAADLPHYKAPPPPPPPPPPLWTGFYVGLNAGYTWSNSQNTTIATWPVANSVVDRNRNLSTAAAAFSASGILPTSTSGFIGGGQIGYNWQFYNSFVAGVEADIQGVAASNSRASASGRRRAGLLPDFSCVSGSYQPLGRWITSERFVAVLGWLFTPTLLVYGTGGLAYGGVTANASSFRAVVGPTPFGIDPSFGAASFSDTRVGWTAGAGLEWMFWPNWSAKIEYLYYDLGT